MNHLSTLHPAERAELRAHAKRANAYRAAGGRLTVDRRDGRHYATSTTTPGTRYYVTLLSCTCPGFIRYQHCKHHSALVIAHLLQEHGITPDPSGMTFVRTPEGSPLGMTYQRPDGWWTVLVATEDGNRKIGDRGNERAAIDAIWDYADRHAWVSDPIAEDPGVDAFFEMIHAHAA